jgi:hypothetical protein
VNSRKRNETPLDRGKPRVTPPNHAADARLTALGPLFPQTRRIFRCSYGGCSLAIFSEGTLGQQNAHNLACMGIRLSVIEHAPQYLAIRQTGSNWFMLIDCVARLILSEHSEAMMYDVSHH